MLKKNIDIQNKEQQITYRTKLTVDIDLVVDICYNITWNKNKNCLKFVRESSQIYLEKLKNKCFVDHRNRGYNFKIDHFSLWLAFEHFKDKLNDEYIDFINNLDIDDKIKINIH